MRRMLLTLAAPMLLLGACAQVDSEPGDELAKLDVAIDANGRVTAAYQTGGESIQLLTRRVVTEVTEGNGVRNEHYVEVDPSASEFQVEVTAVDRQRGIRLLARGDRVKLTSDSASLADKERAMALFGDAILALGASDAAIPVAERRLLEQLGEQAATHPGFEDPVLTPYDTNPDQGCQGKAYRPSMNYASESVSARGQVVCIGDGEEHRMRLQMCLYAEALEVAAQSVVGGTYGNYSGAAVGVETELDCQETDDLTFDAGELEIQSVELGVNVLCGSPRTRYKYRSELNSVTEFNSGIEGFFQGDHDWHKLRDGDGELTAWCGAEPPAPFPNNGGFRPWSPSSGN